MRGRGDKKDKEDKAEKLQGGATALDGFSSLKQVAWFPSGRTSERQGR